MSGSLNKVILIGNLGDDPKIATLNSGSKVANLSIATSERWKDRNTGERRERTEWHRVVIFNEGLVKVAEQYLRKGSLVHIEGQLQTRKWTDQAGVEKYTTEIVLQPYRSELTMLGGRGDNEGGASAPPPPSSGASAPENSGGNTEANSGANSGGNSAENTPPQQNAQQGSGTPPPMGNDLDDDVPF